MLDHGKTRLIMFETATLTIAVLALLLGLGAGAGMMSFIHTGQTRQTIRQQKANAAHLAKLRLAKEKFDYANLLKVIDHERKQLAEVRARELQRTEEMRVAKVAADEANRSKSAFLAVISHEIRTPMTGILGMVKVLQDSTMSKEQHNYVGTIKESGDAMMALLNDILDFEKIESNKVQLESIDFDLHRLLQTISTLMQGHATSKGITLKVDLDTQVPQYVMGDVTRLRQVLLNLIGNAIKFTTTGGVTIRVHLSEEPKPGQTPPLYQIYFAIQDTGIGISAQAQENIFNPFAQADKSITRKFGGTGLGLAISKRLIEGMGSQINLTSREGAGTTFFFTLSMPQGQAHNVTEAPPAPQIPGTSNLRAAVKRHILVVEDNEINRRVLNTLIDVRGHQATLVESGERALEILKTGQTFDLILTDIQMNGMSGLELAPQIRALPHTKEAYIVALTGNVETSDIKACLDAGMNDHLAKPIDPALFDKVIQDMEQRAPLALSENRSAPSTMLPNDPNLVVKPSLDNIQVKNFGFDDDTKPTSLTPTQQAPIMSDIKDITKGLAQAAPAAIFQSDTLDTLKESLGPDQLGGILQGLYDKADEIIAALNHLPQPYDLPLVKARAHELKGMTGNFGLMALSQLAQQIEKKAKENNSLGLADLIFQLQGAYTEGRAAIDAWMSA